MKQCEPTIGPGRTGGRRPPLNGTGSLGMLARLATVFPYMLESERRMLTRSMEERELRELYEIDLRHGLDREAKTYTLIRKPDNTYMIDLPEAKATDIIHGELPNERYHDRVFPKDYRKKKKAKRRQQKQSRRKH